MAEIRRKSDHDLREGAVRPVRETGKRCGGPTAGQPMTEAGLRRIFRTRRLASGALRVRPGWERQPTPCRGEIDTSTSAGSYQEVPDHDRNHPNERPRPHRRPAPAAAPVPGGTRHAVPGQATR